MTTVTSTETITITEADGTVVEVSGPRGPQGATGAVGAAGADADVSALLVKANDLSDLASASTARTNLGLGTMATATATDYLTKAGNLAGLADLPTARTNLGLGTAAVANTGTGASNVILGNDSRLTDTRTPSAASIVDAMIASTLSPSKITGTAAVLGANTFTAQQFIDGSADQIQLRVQGHSTQTSDFLTVENSAGTKIGGWDRYGQLNTQYLTDVTGVSPYLRLQTNSLVAINQGNAANVAFAIRGMAAQAGHLLLCETSSSIPVASISAAGKGLFTNVGPTSGNLNLVDSANDIGVQIRTSDVTIPKRIISSATGASALTMSGQIVAAASTTAASTLRIPHGSAPTSPVDGDMWTTSAGGLFVRVNGVTKQVQFV